MAKISKLTYANLGKTYVEYDDFKKLDDAVNRVRELHTEMNGPYDNMVCSHCTVDEYIYFEYPCPTIKALELIDYNE